MVTFGKVLGVAVIPTGASLFDVLWCTMSAGLPGLSNTEILALIRKRMAVVEEDHWTASYLLEIDEGEQLFDKTDLEKFKKNKEAVEATGEQMKDFERCYRAKVGALKAEAVATQAAGNKAVALVALPMLALPYDVEQSSMKPYLPPRCSLWRDNKRGGWCGQCRDEKRISEPNSRHGSSKESCKAVLRRLWMQHSRIEGVAVVDVCWVTDLFGS